MFEQYKSFRRMKTINDLSDDLIDEILSRVPITSLSVLRSTCKRCNDLSKTHVFGKKAAKNQPFLGFMLIDHKICSFRFNFQGITNEEDNISFDPSVKKKIRIPELEHVLINQIYQYDGLLLCVTNCMSCLVWNPYLGQTRWILPTNRNRLITKYASYVLGYEDNKNNNRRNHKVLRFLYDIGGDQRKYQIELYNFSSNAWRALDVNSDSNDQPNQSTKVSLKGNIYFLDFNQEDHLLCFDFTSERFGTTPLPLPFKPLSFVSLSCVRDEKLVLFHHHHTILERIKIWISTKIEPNGISWSLFFKVDTNHLPHDFPRYIGGIRFFIDEERKLALLFRIGAYTDYHKDERRCCIIGEDRFINYVNMGGALDNHWDYTYRVRNSSYIPSLVQLN